MPWNRRTGPAESLRARTDWFTPTVRFMPVEFLTNDEAGLPVQPVTTRRGLLRAERWRSARAAACAPHMPCAPGPGGVAAEQWK